ncbi:MAG TPA: L-2-amino-thiazoline-4-carboxylic acid hydrolase [Blastocatellia bacterium]|nr:L-2-amino-thiazoline-4-carboxylic acid hydrolase [Blastocatellia bacterium]
MLNTVETQQFVKTTYFTQAVVRLTRLAGRFATDTDAVMTEASAIFDAMLPGLAYLNAPHHPLASALFTCSVNLSLYLALQKRGVDVHAFGYAMLTGLTRAPIPVPQESDEVLRERLAQFAVLAEASQTKAAPGEDVVEFVSGEGTNFEWGYNVKSCAICHQAAKYDAMDLVPYFCAVDDVMSDKGNQGLRRTGSLALGASHCDFRYTRGGEPNRLAEQYPTQIRLVQITSPQPPA